MYPLQTSVLTFLCVHFDEMLWVRLYKLPFLRSNKLMSAISYDGTLYLEITGQAKMGGFKSKRDGVLLNTSCFYREHKNKHSSLSANYILLLLPR